MSFQYLLLTWVSVMRKKEYFWNLFFFQTVSEISVYEMVVFASDMNVNKINAGYAGVHDGFGNGIRKADGSGILEFAER